MASASEINRPSGNTPIGYDAVDAILDYLADRRRNYMVIDGVVHQMAAYTTPCSGCKCDGEYPCTCCRVAGAGCHECGYTGKRRVEYWVPVETMEATDGDA